MIISVLISALLVNRRSSAFQAGQSNSDYDLTLDWGKISFHPLSPSGVKASCRQIKHPGFDWVSDNPEMPRARPQQRTSKPQPTAPRKILCIHGYGQTADWLREHVQQLSSHSKLRGFDFVFADSPVLPKGTGWWRKKGRQYEGCDDALRHLSALFASEGPFIGVLGISQGACLVGMLCGLRSRHSIEPPVDGLSIDFRFAILCSGHKSLDQRFMDLYAEALPAAVLSCSVCQVQIAEQDATVCTRCEQVYYCSRACARQHWGQGHAKQCTSGQVNCTAETAMSSRTLNVPSLHTISTVDMVVAPQQSLELANSFKDPIVFRHGEGHVVPRSDEIVGETIAFIQKWADGH